MINIRDIHQAVAILQNRGLVAFPTETVYGLGADASSDEAVRKVFVAKGRPFDHPLIVHIASPAELTQWARTIPDTAYQLAQAFWPGPLTLVLPKKSHVLDIVTGNQDTVALRVPNHPMALALLNAFGSGLVAPSANLFTHISPTDAAAVHEELAHAVGMILDGGACQVGVESTIVDMTNEVPVILRPGMITANMLSDVLGMTVSQKTRDTTETRVPGQHKLHYAPQTKTVVMTTANLQQHLQTDSRCAVMAYSATIAENALPRVVKLPQEAKGYAQAMYHTLRDLDHLGLSQILIEAVPDNSEWDAIRDRLMKASGERQ